MRQLQCCNFVSKTLSWDFLLWGGGYTYALKAPPPFACPSNLVTMTDATSTLSLKALA